MNGTKLCRMNSTEPCRMNGTIWKNCACKMAVPLEAWKQVVITPTLLKKIADAWTLVRQLLARSWYIPHHTTLLYEVVRPNFCLYGHTFTHQWPHKFNKPQWPNHSLSDQFFLNFCLYGHIFTHQWQYKFNKPQWPYQFVRPVFNMNTFFKWVPTSKSRVTYDLDTGHRHHNAQNYWSSGEPPLPRYACIYYRYI